MTPLMEARDLTVRRAGRQVLGPVSLRIGPGEVVALIGPNGAGKTTLLRAAQGLLPARGSASLAALRPDARARAAAWLPQARDIAWPVSVETVVCLGRTPHLTAGGTPGDADRAAVERALARLDLTGLRHRPATDLSGGEQARVLIARVLAQETPLILADEPVAGLDPGHQIATMGLFRDLAAEGRSVVVSLHDLGLAAQYCDRVVVLDAGRIKGDGVPRAVMTDAALAEVFGVRGRFDRDPDGSDLFQVTGAV